MTGCYPPRVGINRVLFPGEPYGLNPDEFTMPKLFKNAGYSTMIVGKWHCGDQKEFLPDKFGFDEYYGLPYSNDMGINLKTIDKAKYPPLPLVSNGQVIEQQPDQRGLTERYVEKCLEFMRANKNGSFFLYFAQMHVHLPLYAAERFVNESENGDFGACAASLDWACGAIMHELEKLGILDNTMIIFTSDNGSRGDNGSSNFPLKGGKFSTWEGGQRIPCIISWHGRIALGTNGKIASQMDLLPTFAAMLNQDLGKNKIDGFDLSDMIFSGGESPRCDFVYYQSGKKLEAVRKDGWKLHFYKNGAPVKLLYDLEADISENNDLYDQYPEIVAELTDIRDEYEYMLGDDMSGAKGSEARECMTVENPVTLTVYDPDHPYIVAMYDKTETG
jgi:arylsulfatase A-like enzyme